MLSAKRLLSSLTTAATPTGSKSIYNAGTTMTIADNGVLVGTRPHSAPTSSLTWIIPAGSRYESSEEVGYAAALKHAVFLSNKSESALALVRHNEFRGSNITTTVNRDYLMIQADFASDQLTDIVGTVVGMVHGMQADPHELSVLRERLQFEHSNQTGIENLLSDALHRAAYRNGPLGNALHVREAPRLTSDGIVGFMKKAFTRPSYCLFGLNVDHQLVLALQKAAIKDVAPSTVPRKPAAQREYIGGAEERLDIASDRSIISIGFEGSPLSGNMPSLVLMAALGGYPSSIPYFESGDRVLPANCRPFLHTHSDAGLFGLSFEFAADSPRAHVLEGVQQALDRFRSLAISPEQLRRASRIVSFDYASALETKSTLIPLMGHQMFTASNVMDASAFDAALSKVTPATIQETVAQMLRSKPCMAVASPNLRSIPYLSDIFP